MPVLELLLEPGESVISQAGELSWMSQTIAMTTHTQFGGGGGFFGAIKRMAGGGSLFMTEYGAQDYAGEVAFATKIPGHIVPGVGTAWLELGGEVVVRDLRPGETLRVHPGHVGAFQSNVSFGITRIQGIRNMFFGGDGIFLAALTGPGRVWLQTLPLANLAHVLQPYLASEGGGSRIGGGVGTAAVLGGIVGGLLDRDR